jgi:hypothetical protein
MHFDRYDKLIVAERGVELINWPAGVPFVNASEIGSLHTLRVLRAALTLNNDQRCRWEVLSEEEWEKRKAAQQVAEAEAAPPKRKRKATAITEQAESVNTNTNEEGGEPPQKCKRKTTAITQAESVNTNTNEGCGEPPQKHKCKATAITEQAESVNTNTNEGCGEPPQKSRCKATAITEQAESVNTNTNEEAVDARPRRKKAGKTNNTKENDISLTPGSKHATIPSSAASAAKPNTTEANRNGQEKGRQNAGAALAIIIGN